ncbi:mobile mystery protein B [Chloroflexota bacterium]
MVSSKHANGTTPINPDEARGLIPNHLSNLEQLNRWEQDNITEAMLWLEQTKPMDILNIAFIKKLHKRMFCNIWKWAGDFRKTERNLGIAWYNIPTELVVLCGDVVEWIKSDTYPKDEIAVRFHHRLVHIHPFPNGNGRHSRLMTDLLLSNVLKNPIFTWSSDDLRATRGSRERYLEALYAADEYNYGPLLKFVRS